MTGVDGALYAIRRQLYSPPPDDTILDDLAVPMAAAAACHHRTVFEPAARAVEQGSRSAREEFARKVRIVAGAVQFLERVHAIRCLRKPRVCFALMSHKVLRWGSPSFAFAALSASMVLAAESPFYFGMAVLQVAVIAAGLAGCHPRLRRFKPIGLAHYFCLLQAASVVGFGRGLLRRQPAAWQRFQHTPVEIT
jgi:hypothetical protein